MSTNQIYGTNKLSDTAREINENEHKDKAPQFWQIR
jgi:hypothetical protein